MFLIPLFIRFLNAEVVGFFCYEQNLILGSEKSKIQLQKIVGNVLDKPWKSYTEWHSHLNFLAVPNKL